VASLPPLIDCVSKHAPLTYLDCFTRMNIRRLKRGMFENMDGWANIAGKSKAYSSLNPTLQARLLPRHIGGWTKPIKQPPWPPPAAQRSQGWPQMEDSADMSNVAYHLTDPSSSHCQTTACLGQLCAVNLCHSPPPHLSA